MIPELSVDVHASLGCDHMVFQIRTSLSTDIFRVKKSSGHVLAELERTNTCSNAFLLSKYATVASLTAIVTVLFIVSATLIMSGVDSEL